MDRAGSTGVSRVTSEDLYRGRVERSGIALFLLGRQGRRAFINDEGVALMGKSREELLRGRFGDRLVEEDRERAWGLLQETFRTGKGVRNFVSRQYANGELRYISANWEPILDSEGNIAEVQTTSFDVTEQERMRGALRRLCRGLRPAILDRMGLEEAVRWFVRQACQEAGVEGVVEASGENVRLHPAVETRLFRIVQAAVNNALRHGQPKRVEVKLKRADGRLWLEVRDDGRGFEPPESYYHLVEKGQLGLMGMMERAVSLGADLEIESNPGQGTCVRLSRGTRRMEQAVA